MSFKIAIELDIQLNKLDSKLFCPCRIDFQAKPNTKVCEICLGQPGSMPKINIQAIKCVYKLAKYLEMEICDFVLFDRKHYFCPDLPKGYQITQYRKPFAIKGYLNLKLDHQKIQKIAISQIKLEQDPAKTYLNIIDHNRSGIGLCEIITQPVFSNSQQVIKFIKQILNVCQDFKFSNIKLTTVFRADVNTSDNCQRVQIKNIGSLQDIQSAISYEQKRLKKQGNKIIHTLYQRFKQKSLFSSKTDRTGICIFT